ncbi:MAG: hypothetical protein KGZ89_08890 [Actinobacteria bacterium]|nr:hypothetical protein [Actinomycetota bacterium]
MMRRCPVVRWGKVEVQSILAAGLFAGVLLSMLLVGPGLAEASMLPPHVPTELETDACAICHRAHTAASDITRTVPARPWDTTRTALIVGAYTGAADTQLCFSCHGLDALGSEVDVQSAFISSSAHSIAPSPSDFGPSPKRCSSCHDSHGSERTAAGDPFPALLSVVASEGSTATINAGDEFCAACHVIRPGSRWSGIEVWRRTAHSAEMTAPASGTGVTCSNCHASHGSEIAPLIRTTLLPPAAPATQTISENNRTLCFVCHAGGQATYPGRARYEFSGHAMSPATITIAGEWPSADSSRTVGECQSCHAPMGRPLSTGQTVPRLLEAPGRALCDSCHSSGSPVAAAAADLAQFKFPVAASPKLEVAVAYNAGRNPEVFDRLALYSQETTGPLPFDLVGPREYDLPGVAADMAAGDIRGLGINQLIVADSVARRLAVATPDPLAGVIVSTYSITTTPTLVAIGDVLLDGSGRPEVLVVSRSAEATANSSLWVYRWDAATDTLQEVVGGIALDDNASGLTVGRLTRADRDDIVITALSGPSLSVFTESILSPGTLGTLPVRHYVAADGVLGGPRGPSIGDASAATPGNEIAIANSLEATYGVSVFSPSTGLVGSYPHSGAPDARGWDTLIADVLPAVAGTETVLALRNNAGMSSINVFERHATSGLTSPPLAYDTGLHFGSAALAHGDVDSAPDGRLELVVGNAGSWGLARTDNQVPPSVQVFGINAAGTGLTPPETYSGGGAEKAGNTPAIALVDLGGLGASRHPVSVSRDPAALVTAHVSTETAPFELHVECADCHSAHEATSTPSPAAAVAPEVYGRLKGVWGVRTEFTSTSTITYTQRQGVAYEHEVCFECHSGWNRAPGGPDDVAMQFNIHNPSFHPIAAGTSRAENTTGSFVPATPAWTTSSVLHCVDCHGNSDPAQPAGPHYSSTAPLLGRPYLGVPSAEETKLCYSCHRYTVYFTGAEDLLPESTSNFRGATLVEPRLHRLHVNDAGLSCASCHVSHGSRVNEHLIRHGLGWSDSPAGGTCSTQCHAGGIRSYSR